MLHELCAKKGMKLDADVSNKLSVDGQVVSGASPGQK